MSTTTAHTTQRSTLWLLASLYVSQSLGSNSQDLWMKIF